MQLNILADGEIGDSVGVAASEIGDGVQLAGGDEAVGNANAHHEALQCLPYSAGAAGYAGSIALRVDAPPAEIGSDPFRGDGIESLPREAPDFIESFPGIGGALEAFNSLSRGFFGCVCHIFQVEISDKIKNPPPGSLAMG